MTLVTDSVLEASIRKRLKPFLTGDDARSYAARYMHDKCFSKFIGNGGQDGKDRALMKFLLTCERVRSISLTPETFVDEYLIGHFRDRCRNFFDGISPDELSLDNLHQLGGVGPGASVGTRHTDFYRKLYLGPQSCTSLDVYHAYLRGSRSNPLCFSAAKAASKFGVTVDRSSRLSFVEKNVTEHRTIATEPSINMFYQLAVGKVIEKRLKQVYAWDKKLTPAVNRESAFIGSIDNSLATVDLSSASDSISLQLCKMALPGYLNELLELFRCEYTKLPDGRVLKLPMISTMGNGWTFHLMTALLYCACHAVCDVFGSSGDLSRVSVFGDDIIIPSELTRWLYRLLDRLGFVVNTEKSFSDGLFRESCGHDFYQGHYVRPVFVRRLDTEASRYVAANRLLEWSCFHDIDLTPCIRLLKNSTRGFIVPRHYDYASGLRVSSVSARSKLIKGGVWRFKCLMPSLQPLHVDRDGKVGEFDISSAGNPDGAYVSLIGGYLRNGSLMLRPKDVTWRLANKMTPNWDYVNLPRIPGWDERADLNWKVKADLIFTD